MPSNERTDASLSKVFKPRQSRNRTMQDASGLMPLTTAAQHAPGRPHVSCVWRWCRKGVRARTGQRVYLQHVRVGGRVFTTLAWLDDFGHALADADRDYFDLKAEAAATAVPRHEAFSAPTRRSRARSRTPKTAADNRDDRIDAELDQEGL